MRLTPLDITNHEFTRSRTGVSAEEVEEFLGAVARDYEGVLTELASARETLESVEREIERYYTMENTLKEALITAQHSANETRALAQREADAILREAQSKSEVMLRDATERTEALRQQRLRLGWELRALLQAHLDGVQHEIDRSMSETPSLLQAKVEPPVNAAPPTPDNAVAPEAGVGHKSNVKSRT